MTFWTKSEIQYSAHIGALSSASYKGFTKTAFPSTLTSDMKTDIHPKYHAKAKVVCGCGNEFVTGSTMEDIRVELCSKCHPFYTGKQRFVDSAGRVDKFKKKYNL